MVTLNVAPRALFALNSPLPSTFTLGSINILTGFDPKRSMILEQVSQSVGWDT